MVNNTIHGRYIFPLVKYIPNCGWLVINIYMEGKYTIHGGLPIVFGW